MCSVVLCVCCSMMSVTLVDVKEREGETSVVKQHGRQDGRITINNDICSISILLPEELNSCTM